VVDCTERLAGVIVRVLWRWRTGFIVAGSISRVATSLSAFMLRLFFPDSTDLFSRRLFDGTIGTLMLLSGVGSWIRLGPHGRLNCTDTTDGTAGTADTPDVGLVGGAWRYVGRWMDGLAVGIGLVQVCDAGLIGGVVRVDLAALLCGAGVAWNGVAGFRASAVVG